MTPSLKYIYRCIPFLHSVCSVGYHSYILVCWVKIKIQSFYSHTSYYQVIQEALIISKSQIIEYLEVAKALSFLNLASCYSMSFFYTMLKMHITPLAYTQYHRTQSVVYSCYTHIIYTCTPLFLNSLHMSFFPSLSLECYLLALPPDEPQDSLSNGSHAFLLWFILENSIVPFSCLELNFVQT